ncbi:MAG: VCBS repeat-containing protein, partial [Bifidobacteriaceae bacterium]|nr:VCBS repeat-containing protein [Bifidobacteriaceae bacterium]
YAGNGRGGWKGQPRQVGQGWVGLELYAAGDLNNDGKNDILAILPDSTLWAYSGRGNGTFSVPRQVGRGWGTFELAAGADLNGDGRADIVGRNNATGEVFFYQGNGGGSFRAAIKIGTGW